MSQENSRGARNLWIGLLKWGLAAALIVYLIRSDKLSLIELKPLLASPGWTLLILTGMFAILGASFWRWRILVGRLGVSMSFSQAFRLGMVGAFFSAVLPGTVSGDLVKALYVARRYPDRRTLTVSSVLLDRVVGLLALVTVGAAGYLLGRDRIEGLEATNRLLLSTLGHALVLGAAVSIVTLTVLPFVQERLRALIPAALRAKRPGRFVDDVLRIYGGEPSHLWFVFLLSLAIHVASLGLLYGVSSLLFGADAPVPFSLFAMTSAMGLCAMSLPIAPMGLGVGQIAFASMFQALGGLPPHYGATLITGYQALSLVMNLSGGLFYLTYRHEVVTS